MANSINTNIAAYFAQANITTAAAQASSSVARLSSGNRIVQASDDVSALATGTSLLTTVSALRTAQINASQGNSLLQVADGALAQIQSILQQQKSIALQAGSGSLTDTDRGFLNQQFQALTAEIDSLTNSTTFNGVKLINGSLSQTVNVNSNTNKAASSGMSVNFTAIAATNTLILNSVTVTFAASPSAAGDVQMGGSIANTLDNLVAYLNNQNNDTSATALTAANKLKMTNAVYSRNGNSLVVTSRTGGNLSEFFTIDSSAMGSATATVNALGLETVATLTSIGAATIDTDVSATGTGDKFANGAIKVDATTVATVANGDTIRSIVNKINALTVSTGYSAWITGTAGDYTINVKSADLSITGDISGGAAVSGATGITGSATSTDNTVASRFGGGTVGLGQAAVIGVGTTGGSFSILTDQTQQKASSTISFPDIAPGDLTGTSAFGTARQILIEGFTFTFTSTAKTAKAQSEMTIGATLAETLDNAVEAINSFFGGAATNYALRQIEAHREGNSVIISNRQVGNALDQAAGTLTVAVSGGFTGQSVSSANLSNTTNTGVDTSGVMNSAFVGTISGFTSTYVSANKVNLSVTVGGITYSAQNVTSNPTSNTTARMISETGGYFDMLLRANQGVVVSDSASAAVVGQKLDAAFSGVTFYQKRDVSSYTTSGSLLGSSVKFQASDFDGLAVDNIAVTAPSGSNPNGSISFTVNGEAYGSLISMGTQLGAYSITKFVSASDANKFIEFRNGGTALSFASAEDASTLQVALRTAFGVGKGDGALQFQIGTTADDTVSVSLTSAKTVDLYGGKDLDVSTQGGATEAATTLEDSINTITALRATVGALQSRFSFASAALQTSVQNQDAARGQLLDTDIAIESTAFATAQVKLQAGISVLAQANQQLQALLKLIG